MSFREKTAWVCLISTIAVYVPYFAHVYRLFDRGELTAGTALSLFIGAVVAQTLLGIASGAAIAIVGSRQAPRDERDAAIGCRSYRNAYLILVSACFSAVVGVVALTLAPASSARRLEPVAIAQVLFLCGVVAEAGRYLTQAVSYRRGV